MSWPFLMYSDHQGRHGHSPSATFQQTFDGAIFHCEDKQASSLRIYCPCLYYQAIDNTFQDPSIFEPVSRSSDDCHIPCRPPSTTTQQIIPMGSWPRTTSPSRVHSGQTKVGVPKWSTHHFLCWFSLPTYAQHLGQNDFLTHPSGLSKPLRLWWCLHTSRDPSICASWRQLNLGQSRSSWILHQHWPRPLHWSLVHALRLPSSEDECVR